MESTALKGEHDQNTKSKIASDKREVFVGRSDSVPERGRLVVDIDEKLTIGVFRIENQLFAYENTCTHSGGPICQGRILPRVVEVIDSAQAVQGQNWDESDLHIICPWHGFEYSIKTGRHAGDARIRLRSFPVREQGGVIYVQL